MKACVCLYSVPSRYTCNQLLVATAHGSAQDKEFCSARTSCINQGKEQYASTAMSTKFQRGAHQDRREVVDIRGLLIVANLPATCTDRFRVPSIRLSASAPQDCTLNHVTIVQSPIPEAN